MTTSNSDEGVPPSAWLTYADAGARLGLTEGQVAARARRGRWPTRANSDTGEAEVEVPIALMNAGLAETRLVPDLALRDRVSQAVGMVERDEARREREQAYDEERVIAREWAAAPRRSWWRFWR